MHLRILNTWLLPVWLLFSPSASWKLRSFSRNSISKQALMTLSYDTRGGGRGVSLTSNVLETGAHLNTVQGGKKLKSSAFSVTCVLCVECSTLFSVSHWRLMGLWSLSPWNASQSCWLWDLVPLPPAQRICTHKSCWHYWTVACAQCKDKRHNQGVRAAISLLEARAINFVQPRNQGSSNVGYPVFFIL